MGNFAGFQSVQLNKPLRSTFDLGHHKRSTTRMGRLTPVLITECVPSDTFRGSSEILLRLAPLLAPIYDQINLYVHFFFVPNRLLWEEWETFITGGRLGVGIDPAIAPIPPYCSMENVMDLDPTAFDASKLSDYLGVPVFPPGIYEDINLDVMPFAAYHLIWFEYYRDRNFVSDEQLSFPLASGEYPASDFVADYSNTRTRAYLHDYFTSALPFTQRGEEVLMPLSGTGSVTYLNQSIVNASPIGGATSAGELESTGGVFDTPNLGVGIVPTDNPVQIKNIDEIVIDSSSVSINDFRSAYALQVWLERNAIGGSRYTESTQAHFGVKPQDSRLQRPEYIGGGRISVQIAEVVAANWSSDGTSEVPQGNMAGHGVTYGNTNQFNYFCTEHGFIMGIASIMNPPSYQQGLPRMFRRRSFLDYPWPTFAKLGEQPVHDYEIFADVTSMTEDENGDVPLFGYQSRYADWKYICNTNHGDFKTTLLFWTLTRTFADQPVLSEEFNTFQDDTQDRIFAVGGPTNDNFWLYINNKLTVKRPLPYFGTPNTLGFS